MFDAVHPLRHPLERLTDVGADPGLGQRPRELLGCGLGGVLGHRVERLQQREARRQAAGNEREHVGQLRLELLASPPRQEPQDERRQQVSQDSARRPGRTASCRGHRGRAIRATATPTTTATSRSTHHSPARRGRSARSMSAMVLLVDSRPSMTLSPRFTSPLEIACGLTDLAFSAISDGAGRDVALDALDSPLPARGEERSCQSRSRHPARQDQQPRGQGAAAVTCRPAWATQQ